MLVVIGGLTATGKTTPARLLAAQTGAVHVREDTIEQALVRSGPARHPVGPAGYGVGYAPAEGQLRQGLSVIAESVKPLAVTRNAWRNPAGGCRLGRGGGGLLGAGGVPATSGFTVGGRPRSAAAAPGRGHRQAVRAVGPRTHRRGHRRDTPDESPAAPVMAITVHS